MARPGGDLRSRRSSPTPGTGRWSTWSARGRLDTLLTQNVDGLHHAAGSDPAMIVEVHGTVREYVCLDCGDRGPDRGGARPGAGRRGGPALSHLRGDPEVGHDQLRPGAGRRRSGAGRRGRPQLRPAPRAGHDAGRAPDRRCRAAGGEPRGPHRDRQPRAHRDGRPGRRGDPRPARRGAPRPRGRPAAARCASAAR